MSGGISGYLARTRAYRWPRFLVEAAGVALLLRIPAVWIGASLVGVEARTAYDWLAEYDVAQLVLIAVVVGPLVETIVAQWLPVALAQRLVDGDARPVLLSALFFGFLHLSQGALLVVVMFTTGLVLAWAFVVWRRRGLWPAIAITTGVHALLNGVALVAALLTPGSAV